MTILLLFTLIKMEISFFFANLFQSVSRAARHEQSFPDNIVKFVKLEILVQVHLSNFKVFIAKTFKNYLKPYYFSFGIKNNYNNRTAMVEIAVNRYF